METFIAIAVLGVGALMGAITWLRSKMRRGTTVSSTLTSKQSPYEKHLAAHATDWNIRWQRKEFVRNKMLLQDATRNADHTAIKIHKSMMVFSKSVINHLYQKLRESYQK